MRAACFRAQEANQLPLGRSDDGRNVYAPFRPTVIQLSRLLTPFLNDIAGLGDALPFPRGFTPSKCEASGQLQLARSDLDNPVAILDYPYGIVHPPNEAGLRLHRRNQSQLCLTPLFLPTILG